jgi:hypothetical protein
MKKSVYKHQREGNPYSALGFVASSPYCLQLDSQEYKGSGRAAKFGAEILYSKISISSTTRLKKKGRPSAQSSHFNYKINLIKKITR